MTYADYPAPGTPGAHWFEVDGTASISYPRDFFGDSTTTFGDSPQRFQDTTLCVVEGMLIERGVAASTVSLFNRSDLVTPIHDFTISDTVGPSGLPPLYVPLGNPGMLLSEPFGVSTSNASNDIFVFYRFIR